MNKVMIKYKHDNESFSCMGYKDNNCLVFISNGDRLDIMIEDNIVKITKTNKLGIIKMKFEENKVIPATYDVKDMGKVDLNIKTNVLIIKKNQLFIDYEIVESNDKHLYQLEYEVV